jgi:hypothetical protein
VCKDFRAPILHVNGDVSPSSMDSGAFRAIAKPVSVGLFGLLIRHDLPTREIIGRIGTAPTAVLFCSYGEGLEELMKPAWGSA